VDKRFKEVRDSTKELKAFRERVWSVAEVMDRSRLTRRLLDESAKAFEADSGLVELRGLGLVDRQTYGDWSGTPHIEVEIAFNGTQYERLALGPRRKGVKYGQADVQHLQESASAVAYAIALAEHKDWLRPSSVNNYVDEETETPARSEAPA
jgi:hypothetical protein